jgi:phosphopantothenoylcysteine decarboxylase/phosphopantothenate--cysteine ligase
MSRSADAAVKRHILLLMSGSIACAKASGLVSAWVKAGHEVRVAITRSVERFVGHATLEGFSGHPVLADAFTPGQIMDHVNLARWADLVVAAPATSNLINKLAAGIADDAVTSLWQAAWGRGYPLVIVPAMNTRMWQYPATQESLRRLASWGVQVLPTADGDLACGELGEGRMLEVDDILQRVEALLLPPGAARRRVLVTGGGTREPIDSVRFIGNASTGRTAAALADALAGRGHEVTWLGAASAARPDSACRQETFLTFADLEAALRSLLGEQPFDAIVHAAAVSDFSVDRVIAPGAGDSAPGGSKLPSDQPLGLQLKPNPKLLDRLRAWSANPDVRIVGFKLTHTPDAAARTRAVQSLFERAGVAAVVHNDLGAMAEGRHPFTAHTPDRTAVNLDGVAALAGWLAHWLESGS